MTEVLTIQEVAERFKVSENAVRRAIAAGRLRAAKVGGKAMDSGRWRIALEDAPACFEVSAHPTLKALYREFRAAKSARLATEEAAPSAGRAN